MLETFSMMISDTVKKIPAGAGGVIFTPWLHGNRCPFEDPNAAGMFFNIRIGTGKTEMIRAVLEGICFHLRWMLECEDKKVKTSQTIRFVGGAAILVAVGCGAIADFDHVEEYIPVKARYEPDPKTHHIYDRNYKVFRRLYQNNKENFTILNEGRSE